MVTDRFVETVSSLISPSTFVFIQSDLEDVCAGMAISLQKKLESAQGYDPDNLLNNPSLFNIKSEREIATIKKGLPVFRMCFTGKGRAF